MTHDWLEFLVRMVLPALTTARDELGPGALRSRVNVALDNLRVVESWLLQGCQCANSRRFCPLHTHEPAPEVA